MAVVYFDSSALVKILVNEPGRDLAVDLWDGCDVAIASRLAYPEVHAALAAARRRDRLEPREFGRAERLWSELWDEVQVVALSESVAQRAGRLVRNHALGGADAVHLASALTVDTPDLVFATWDRRLRSGARAAGLRLAPAPSPSTG